MCFAASVLRLAACMYASYRMRASTQALASQLLGSELPQYTYTCGSGPDPRRHAARA